MKPEKTLEQIAWDEYPLRVCRSLHGCCLCGGDIPYGRSYEEPAMTGAELFTAWCVFTCVHVSFVYGGALPSHHAFIASFWQGVSFLFVWTIATGRRPTP